MIRKRTSRKGVRYSPEVYNPAVGRRQSAREILGLDRGTFDTRTEAKRVERRMEEAVENQTARPDAGPTVAEWVDRWLAEYPRVKESTNHTNRSALKPLVDEHGDVLLRDFTRDMARLIGIDRPHTARVAQAAWNDAMYEAELDCISKNPWTRLKLPPAGRRTLALSEEEVRTLAELAPRVLGGYGVVMRGMILFSAYTGLRLGELCAMRHDWVDGDTLWVRRSLSRQGVETSCKHRKESDPAQGIPLVDEAKAALASVPRTISGYVWTLPTGVRLEHQAHHPHWSKVRTAFLMLDRDPNRQQLLEKELVWHSLRHSCATLLAEMGFTRYEAMLVMRHKDPSMVDGIYTHIDEAKAREKIVAAFRERAVKASVTSVSSETMSESNK